MILACCLAVAAGLILAKFYYLDNTIWIWLIAPFAILSLRHHNAITLTLICFLFLGIGWWRGSVFVDRLEVHGSFHYQKVVLVARATEDAVYGKYSQLEFSANKIQVISPQTTALVGGLTVRGFGEPAVYRGDLVRITGKFYPTLGNNLASVNYAELKVLERDTSWINSLRREFVAGMLSALPEPVASFGLGLLIGQRNTLPQETSDELRRAGLTHIIAVSGYNLTIIVLACRRLLAKRSKFQATACCLILVGVFLLITGSSPPIVRASIISLLAIGAWYWGRNIKALVILALAAAITVLANPLYIWGNVSWYLSFLAFFGVLVLAPLITRRLLGDLEPKVVVGILIESACANILVIPYILFIFGQVSAIGLVANLLVIPLIPVAMLLVLCAGLTGMFLPALAGWIAWPANLLLTYMLDVASLLSRVPGAFLQGISFSVTYLAISYTIIGIICLILWSKTRVRFVPMAGIEVQSKVV